MARELGEAALRSATRDQSGGDGVAPACANSTVGSHHSSCIVRFTDRVRVGQGVLEKRSNRTGNTAWLELLHLTHTRGGRLGEEPLLRVHFAEAPLLKTRARAGVQSHLEKLIHSD
jgi:hypothetical protein